ncbi:MAG: sigma-70 family RNA polymerase sigma factor [Myxococcota bacterium]
MPTTISSGGARRNVTEGGGLRRGAPGGITGRNGIDVESAYATYGPMVLRRCRQLLKDEERALDAMHDTFVRLLRSRERLEDKGLSSLLWRMATNVCLNHLRTRRRHPETPSEALLLEIAGWDETEARTLGARFLERVFATQPPSTRTIAVLHLVDGMTLEEVAQEVGMSVSGVRKRLRKVRALAEGLARKGEDDERTA